MHKKIILISIVMKTKINKRDVMKEAWSRYRWDRLSGRKLMTFAFYLKMAWKKMKELVKTYVTYYADPIEEYYHGEGSKGRYFGD